MNIRSIIFACIVGMAAIAATHEIDQEASYAEATAFVQSFLGEEMQDGSGMQKKDSACQKVANDSIKDVQDTCAKQLKVIKKLAKGKQLCCTRGRTAWCKAKVRHAASKIKGGTCKNQLSSTKKTTVNFGGVKFENLKPGQCGTFFKSSAYKNVKSKVDAKKRECQTIKGATNAFAKGLRDAKTGAATARRSCHSADKRSYNTAYRNAKNICESKMNKKMFTRAKHMLCVLKGTKMSKCKVGKIPSLPKTKYVNYMCSAKMKTQCLNPKVKGLTNRSGMTRFSAFSGGAYGEAWYKNHNSQAWNGKVSSSLDISLGEGVQWKSGNIQGGCGHTIIGLASKDKVHINLAYQYINYAFYTAGGSTSIYESNGSPSCNVGGSNCNRGGTRGDHAGTYKIVRCYDGTIRYYSNGQLVRKTGQSTIPPTQKAAFSGSFHYHYAAFKNLVKVSAKC